MYITFLKFAKNRAAAPDFMAAHNDWIARGFSEGRLLCVGSLLPAGGGVILAPNQDQAAFEAFVASDPFVVQGIVTAEIHAFDPKRTVPALDFLKTA